MELRQIESKLRKLVQTDRRRTDNSQSQFDRLVQLLSEYYGEQVSMKNFREIVGAGYDGNGKGDKTTQRLGRFIKASSQVYTKIDKTRSLYQSLSRDRGVKTMISRVVRFSQVKPERTVRARPCLTDTELTALLEERRLRETLDFLIREAHKEYDLDPLAYEAKRAIPEPTNELEIRVKEALNYYNTLILACNVLKNTSLVWNHFKELKDVSIIGASDRVVGLGVRSTDRTRENLDLDLIEPDPIEADLEGT